MIKFGVKVQKETYTARIGIEGGQKSQKNVPKLLKREKTKKKEPNSQNRSVLWLAGDAIHEIRGLSPYGDLGGTWTLRRGVILQNIAQKLLFQMPKSPKQES